VAGPEVVAARLTATMVREGLRDGGEKARTEGKRSKKGRGRWPGRANDSADPNTQTQKLRRTTIS